MQEPGVSKLVSVKFDPHHTELPPPVVRPAMEAMGVAGD
jgi:hypothetical protein